MGTWELGVFDNDDALDWVYELEESNDDAVLRATLMDPEFDYAEIDAGVGSMILAAAAVVDALAGGSSVELTEEVQAWIAAHGFRPAADLLAAARRGVEAVLGEGSEQVALWEEVGKLEQWRAGIERLRDSLAAHSA